MHLQVGHRFAGLEVEIVSDKVALHRRGIIGRGRSPKGEQ